MMPTRGPNDRHSMRLADLRPLLELVRIPRSVLLRLGLASAVGAALPMVSILLLQQFLAGVLGEGHGLSARIAQRSGPENAIWILALLLLASVLGSAAIGFHNTVVQQRLVRTIELGVLERLIGHLLTLSVLTIERQSHGDLIEAVREDVGRLRLVIMSAANGIMRATMGVALIASAVWLSPTLAAVSFPILFVAAAPLIAVAREVGRRSHGIRRRAYRVFDLLLQMLRGMRIIKAYRGERAEAAHAVEQMHYYYSELIDLARTEALGQVALELLAGLSVVVVVIVGGFQVMHGRLTWPSLLAFVMAMRAAQGPLAEINTTVLQIQRNLAGANRLRQLLAEQPTLRDLPDATPFDGPLHRVAFDRVGFAYEPERPLLRDVSFEIRRGEILGIVGPSGAGKTTLLGLTARFFDPLSGRVLFNDRDARGYRLADLYNLVAIVTQDAFLFSTTVRENIRCGRPDATDSDVEAAARAAEIHDDIAALPNGYDTLVGTGHRALSGGQAQRVNIARAILKNAPLLLLDEATSSLDSIAEARVQRAISRLMEGRTTLVVAHRLSTLRNATRILVLNRGRVMSIGTHEELMRESPLYQRMWNTQHRSGRGTEAAPDVPTGAARGVPS